MALHVRQHSAQRCRDQDAADHPIGEDHRAGRDKRRRRGSQVGDVLVAEGVVESLEHGLDDRFSREVRPAAEDQAARVGGVGLTDLQDGVASRIEDHDRAEPVVDLQRNDQLTQRGGVAGGHRPVHPLGVGEQPDRRHLATLQLDRCVQRRVLRVRELVRDPVLQRGRDQAGGQVGSHHTQNQHQEEERQDDLGPDPQPRSEREVSRQAHPLYNRWAGGMLHTFQLGCPQYPSPLARVPDRAQPPWLLLWQLNDRAAIAGPVGV